MPCDTIQTVALELGKLNASFLMEALKAMGYTPVEYNDRISFGRNVYVKATGELLTTNRVGGETVDRIKQAYSVEVVKSQCKRFGWTMKQVGTRKWEVVRR